MLIIYILKMCQICLHAFSANPELSTLFFLVSLNSTFTVLSLFQCLLLGRPTLTPPSNVHSVVPIHTGNKLAEVAVM